jgi:hypothetical protein
MARLLIKGDSLHLSLSGWEQLGSLHADIRVPLRHIDSVESSENPRRLLKGIRAPGTGFPGIIMLGTMRWKGKKDFCVVYLRHSAVVVSLRDEPFARLIVTSDQAEQLTQRINDRLNLS